MRMRLIVETDWKGTAKSFREFMQTNLASLGNVIPGEIVYVATDVADTAVVSHDGKIPTRG